MEHPGRDGRRGLFGRSSAKGQTQRATPPAPGAGKPPARRAPVTGQRQAARRTDPGHGRRLAGASVTQPDLGEVLRLVVDRVREFTGASGAAVGLLDGEHVVLRSASGSALAHLGLRVPLEGSLSGAAIREGNAQRCDDTGRDTRVDRDLAFKLSARSLLVIPLYHLNRAVGTLTVVSSKA